MPFLGTARNLFARLGASLRSYSLGVGAVPSAPVLSGTYITPQTAIGLTAVYSAIQVISKDLAALPLGLYERQADGGLKLDPTDYYQELLGVETDDDTSAMKFTLDGSGHTLGWGNGYAEIVRGSRGRAEAIHLLHPAKTVPKRRPKTNQLYYLLTETETELLPENVLHFAGLGFDGLRGYSPITVCRQSLGLGIGAEQFGASFFGNGAIAGGFLKLKKKLSEAALNNLRRSFNQVHQGSQSANQVGILEEDMDFINRQVSPEDAQFLATRQFTVLEVARLFNLPPHKIGDYSQSHLTNIEQANLDYLASTLAFWVTLRERVLNRRLLTSDDRRRYVILYDLRALLRGDSAARTAYYKDLRNLGAINSDEIRLAENMRPIGTAKGGDKFLVQGQYIPLEQAGKSLDTGGKSRAAKRRPARRPRRRPKSFAIADPFSRNGHSS